MTTPNRLINSVCLKANRDVSLAKSCPHAEVLYFYGHYFEKQLTISLIHILITPLEPPCKVDLCSLKNVCTRHPVFIMKKKKRFVKLQASEYVQKQRWFFFFLFDLGRLYYMSSCCYHG